MKIQDILKWLNENNVKYTFIGDDQTEIVGFSSLGNYKAGTLTWIKESEAFEKSKSVDIAAAVVQRDVTVRETNAIFVDASKEIFFTIVHQFWGNQAKHSGVGCGTYLSDCVKKDETVIIGSNCSIVGDVSIGENTIIENNVVIQGHVVIGNNCIIHSGAIIGCDGFGYYYEDDGTIGKVEHFGGVFIEDNVEIGANTCIDRGTIDDTFVGFNSKLDNLVHVAHNVHIGRNVSVVAGTLICGSVKIFDGAYIAPGGIVKNQLTIGQNGFVGLGAVVINDVEEGTVVTGVPAKLFRKIRKGDK